MSKEEKKLQRPSVENYCLHIIYFYFFVQIYNFIFNFASLLHKIYTILCSTKYKLHKIPPQILGGLRENV